MAIIVLSWMNFSWFTLHKQKCAKVNQIPAVNMKQNSTQSRPPFASSSEPVSGGEWTSKILRSQTNAFKLCQKVVLLPCAKKLAMFWMGRASFCWGFSYNSEGALSWFRSTTRVNVVNLKWVELNFLWRPHQVTTWSSLKFLWIQSWKATALPSCT